LSVTICHSCESRNPVFSHKYNLPQFIEKLQDQFKKLQKHLESFPDLPILTEDYVAAAQLFNHCRSKGIQGSNTDFLICAVAVKNKFSIYTMDKDFEMFSKYIQIVLHKAD